MTFIVETFVVLVHHRLAFTVGVDLVCDTLTREIVFNEGVAVVVVVLPIQVRLFAPNCMCRGHTHVMFESCSFVKHM